ncbi:hypothetical protein A2U01_0091524, partial [Trifolium medium]|nr:hypothetical protein [Trifolium medium]
SEIRVQYAVGICL